MVTYYTNAGWECYSEFAFWGTGVTNERHARKCFEDCKQSKVPAMLCHGTRVLENYIPQDGVFHDILEKERVNA